MAIRLNFFFFYLLLPGKTDGTRVGGRQGVGIMKGTEESEEKRHS